MNFLLQPYSVLVFIYISRNGYTGVTRSMNFVCENYVRYVRVIMYVPMRTAFLKQRLSIYKYKRIYREVLDRLCGLVVRVLGYRSGGPGSIPGTTRKKNVVGLERNPLSLVSTN
jgi:hypothetical protein